MKHYVQFFRRINIFLILALLLGQAAVVLPASAHNALMAGQAGCSTMGHVSENTPSQPQHSHMQDGQAASADCCDKPDHSLNCMLDCLSTCTVFLTALQEAAPGQQTFPPVTQKILIETDILVSRVTETTSPPPKA